jgi:hypothetical protein
MEEPQIHIRQVYRDCLQKPEQLHPKILEAQYEQDATKLKELNDELKEANKKITQAKKAYDDMQNKRKVKDGTFEAILHQIMNTYHVAPEAYHGGALTYRDCHNLMKSIKDVMKKVLHALLPNWSLAQATVSEEDFTRKMEHYQQQFELQDAIWSTVRGCQGLLPTSDELDKLESTIATAKTSWLALGLNIALNPKAHLLFDGHLIEQMRRHGGIADKADDVIERGHQVHRRHEKRTYGIRNYAQQQANQQRTVYREASAIVQRGIAEIEKKRKRPMNNEAVKKIKVSDAIQAKMEKREAAVGKAKQDLQSQMLLMPTF